MRRMAGGGGGSDQLGAELTAEWRGVAFADRQVSTTVRSALWMRTAMVDVGRTSFGSLRNVDLVHRSLMYCVQPIRMQSVICLDG